MNIAIIGGHDRLVCKYSQVCEKFGYKCKICTHQCKNMKCIIKSSDLIVLFTSLVSHSMANIARNIAAKNKVELVCIHSASKNALKEVLLEKKKH